MFATLMNYLKTLKKSKLEYVLITLCIGIAICKLMMYMSTERFSQIDVAHGDITLYSRDSCPFCVKQKAALEKVADVNSKIINIDVETKEGAEKFQRVSASGVPHFECKSTGKSSSGYKEVPELLSSLGL